MEVELYTSGTTGQPKRIIHSKEIILNAAERLNEYLKLTSQDVILDIFPSFTIAHWVFCIGLQKVSGAKLVCAEFKPTRFWGVMNDVRPTFFPVAIRTFRTLLKMDDGHLTWSPKILTGSAPMTDTDIYNMLSRGCSEVWNVYGSTEFPPPILISKNSVSFDLNEQEFTDEGELLVDGQLSGDIFDLNNGQFLKRKQDEISKTWKS